jgi:broad specificity phosphatase PhoE
MLILVRHGESTGNADGLLLGRIDAPLTERGLAQAKTVGPLVSTATRLISSPLRRARDTAAALGIDAPVEIDERWIEVDYGDYDGRPLGDVPDEVWARWRADPDFRPSGGESLSEAGARVRSACEELFAVDGEGARGSGAVVVVSHVSPIKAATCWALGLGDQGAWRLYLATASITRITWGAGGPVLAKFNDTPWSGPEPSGRA